MDYRVWPCGSAAFHSCSVKILNHHSANCLIQLFLFLHLLKTFLIYFSCDNGLNLVFEIVSQLFPRFFPWNHLYSWLMIFPFCWLCKALVLKCRVKSSQKSHLSSCLLEIYKALSPRFFSWNYILFPRAMLLACLFSHCGFIENISPSRVLTCKKVNGN